MRNKFRKDFSTARIGGCLLTPFLLDHSERSARKRSLHIVQHKYNSRTLRLDDYCTHFSSSSAFEDVQEYVDPRVEEVISHPEDNYIGRHLRTFREQPKFLLP